MEGFKRRGLLALEPIGTKMLEFANDSLPFVESVFSALEEHGPAAMEAVGSAFSSGLDWLEERLGGNNETVQKILDKAAQFWEQHGEGILDVLGNLGEMAGIIFDRFINNILDIVDLGISILIGDWAGAADALTQIWEGTKESAGQIFQLALDNILTLIDGFVPGFKEKGQAVIDGLLDGLKEKWAGVVSWFSGLRLPNIDLNPFDGNATGAAYYTPAYATGTAYAPSGLSWVGERGPELVRLPRGAQVFNAAQSRALGGARGGDTITINITGMDNAQQVGRAAERGVLSAKRRAGM